jgi:hypothetical protein
MYRRLTRPFQMMQVQVRGLKRPQRQHRQRYRQPLVQQLRPETALMSPR